MTSIDLTIPAQHPAFAGHFPGNPIVPGVVLIDEAVQAIGSMVDAEWTVCRLQSVKFLSPARPGEALRLTHTRSADDSVRFDITAGDRRVATGSVRLEQP